MDSYSERSYLVQNHRHPPEQNELSRLNRNLYSDNRSILCSIKELQDLVESKGKESLIKIRRKFGNETELCKRLKTGKYKFMNEYSMYL